MPPKRLFPVAWDNQCGRLKTQISAFGYKYELVHLRSLFLGGGAKGK